MKHTRKILAAAGLFALAPLVGCDQGVEDASAPDGATTGADRGMQQQPPAERTEEPPTIQEPDEIDDPSAGG